MSKKYALVIGNNQHNDPLWPDLKTPERDAEAVAAVLKDPKIGGFDRVNILLNATAKQMRIAIAELFDPHAHQSDDLLLLYFSGHGELDSSNTLYFVGKDTRRSMLWSTALDAGYITGFLGRARSRRQVIILDSCYSGAFGKSAKGSVPTREIFAGYGRHILTASEALQLSWEGDEALGEVQNSFFTHFLVEGLQTGAADRNNDGLIDVDELYDHIREGMAKQSRKQIPLKFSLEAAGNLIIARSPVSPLERAREQLTDLLVQAEKAAERSDYKGAETLLKRVIKAEPEGFLARSAQQMLAEITAECNRTAAYNDVKRLAGRSRRMARIAWKTFTQQYPNYDPDNLAARLTIVHIPKKPTAKDLLPAPFAFIEIPGKGYSIAKYPLTNAQFAPFIKDGGYKTKKWWTKAGWQECKKNKWTEPRYWTNSKWNGAKQPVVGVSWYEAAAYCLWLSEKTGRKIMLPTEEQWQYAAQGDDGREYPWGNKWDCKRCNNSVSPCNSNVTTPVTQYEGKGDSPFGVIDMAGNVWEWCLTEYETGKNTLDGTNVRVLRGGSWNYNLTDYFRVSARDRLTPNFGNDYGGFRLALSL